MNSARAGRPTSPTPSAPLPASEAEGRRLSLAATSAGDASLRLTSEGWRQGAARAHAVVVAVLNSTETLIAARRLAEARPHLAAIAGIARHEDLWRLCRDELTGVDVRIDGWDIRGRWFGVVVVATPRLGELRRGETIPWRVVAAQIAASDAAARVDQDGLVM